MEPTVVWRTDFARVTEADLVVAYVGVPAFGVGSEIEIARTVGVPVILVCEADRLAHVSRLALGSPAVKTVLAFENHAELGHLLVDAIRSVHAWQMPSGSASSVERLANDVVTSAKDKARHKRAERNRAGPKPELVDRLA